MLHLVGGVARVGRAEGVEEEVVERKRKKKMRLNKICADTKVTIFSGKKTKKTFFVRKERLEYTFLADFLAQRNSNERTLRVSVH